MGTDFTSLHYVYHLRSKHQISNCSHHYNNFFKTGCLPSTGRCAPSFFYPESKYVSVVICVLSVRPSLLLSVLSLIISEFE